MNTIAVFVPPILAALLFGILLHLERTRIVGYWIEHCVDQFRPKYQEGARRGCEEEAERWRYGTEEPFDWSGYDDSMEIIIERTDNTPECLAADEALRRCNEALKTTEVP